MVSTFADTFASPVVIDESPPVLKLELLSPELAAKFSVLPIVASLLCAVLLLFVLLFVALLVDPAPFPELDVLLVAPQPFEQELEALPGDKIISPV